MIDFFFPTEGMGSQTLRTVAESQMGGGDVFEIARTLRDVEPGDHPAWEKAWKDKAEDTEARAKKALAAGKNRTAMQYFYAANNYWRMADVFLRIDRNDEKAALFAKSQENFRAGAALNDPPIEVIEVKCGDETYDGYFCHPRNPKTEKWPAVFFIGGADAFAEEIYFRGARCANVATPCCSSTRPAEARRCISRTSRRGPITRCPARRASITCSRGPRSIPTGSG